MKTIIKDLRVFFRNANIHGLTLTNLRLRKLIRIYFANLGLGIIAIVITILFYEILNIQNALEYFPNIRKENSSFFRILMFCVFLPVLEELGFRLWIVYSKINVAVLISCCSFFLFQYSISGRGIFGEKNAMSLQVSLAFIVLAVVFSMLNENKHLEKRIKHFWSQNSQYFIYISLILYSLFCVEYYVVNVVSISFSLLLVLPQIICGILFSYTRIKYGMTLAISSHAFYNVFLCLLFL